MAGNEDEQAERQLVFERILNAPDQYRQRARSVATILGTGAGALSAGLVFSDFQVRFGPLAVVLGYCALISLILSVIFFIAASTYGEHEKQPDQKPPSIGAEPARTSLVDSGRQKSKELLGRIDKRARIGSIAGVVAAAFFIAMMVAVQFEHRWVLVRAELVASSPWLSSSSCPNLSAAFNALVLQSDLESESPFITFRVAAESCIGEGGTDISLRVARSEVLIASLADG